MGVGYLVDEIDLLHDHYKLFRKGQEYAMRGVNNLYGAVDDMRRYIGDVLNEAEYDEYNSLLRDIETSARKNGYFNTLMALQGLAEEVDAPVQKRLSIAFEAFTKAENQLSEAIDIVREHIEDSIDLPHMVESVDYYLDEVDNLEDYLSEWEIAMLVEDANFLLGRIQQTFGR